MPALSRPRTHSGPPDPFWDLAYCACVSSLGGPQPYSATLPLCHSAMVYPLICGKQSSTEAEAEVEGW